MDNAAKALLMAGGILIAIIVISLFIMAYSNITQLAQLKADEELRQEIVESNKKYLAFNKTAMYGTDVISILNLVISDNRINNVKAGEELYINVEFKLTKDSIQDTVYQYTLDPSTGIYKSELLTKDKSSFGAGNFSFEVNHVYSLSSNLDAINAFLRTADSAEETRRNISTSGDVVTKYTITYSGIADFKRKTFKCAKIEYDANGRVKNLRFEQIQESVYGKD